MQPNGLDPALFMALLPVISSLVLVLVRLTPVEDDLKPHMVSVYSAVLMVLAYLAGASIGQALSIFAAGGLASNIHALARKTPEAIGRIKAQRAQASQDALPKPPEQDNAPQ